MPRRRLFLALAAGAWLAALTGLAPPPATAQTPPPLALAEPWRNGLPLGDYWVSEKYDGIRALWDGQRLLTRGGEQVAAPAWFTQGWPATPLDGELWAGRGGFAQVQSTALRLQPQEAAWRRLRFMAFDLPAHPGPFDERLPALQRAVQAARNPYLHAVPQRRLASEAELHALLRQITRAGGEGLMLRRGSARHRVGRSGDLLKLKTHDDAEARVIAHLPGKGRHAGRLGALLVETPDGRRFRLGTGFSDAQRDHPPPVGAWVTYRYRGVHEKTGLPRFASFVRVRADEPRWRPPGPGPDIAPSRR
ncbi:MAG: DNA ligase [Comamonadaceae bacterium]|nr:DNA ligase [Comamonadaceae bacterium]